VGGYAIIPKELDDRPRFILPRYQTQLYTYAANAALGLNPDSYIKENSSRDYSEYVRYIVPFMQLEDAEIRSAALRALSRATNNFIGFPSQPPKPAAIQADGQVAKVFELIEVSQFSDIRKEARHFIYYLSMTQRNSVAQKAALAFSNRDAGSNDEERLMNWLVYLKHRSQPIPDEVISNSLIKLREIETRGATGTYKAAKALAWCIVTGGAVQLTEDQRSLFEADAKNLPSEDWKKLTTNCQK
jgi:hypothetical protein